MRRMATPLALAVDGFLRHGKVKSVKQADGDWHRESYKQMGGFVLGAFGGGLAGYGTVKYGATLSIAKFGIALGSGPIGWALLGCVVVVSVGVALGAGKVSGAGGEWLGGDLIYNLKYK